MKCMRPGKCSGAGLRPEVAIDTGVLLGKYRKTPGGSSFSSFTKIPFAEPPLGDLRFSLPVPARPWEGVRDAGKPCPKPIQNNYVTGLLEGQEDCLYINVYRPEAEEDEEENEPQELLPVMFWVYGGGFIMGDASEENYLPGPLLDTREVIVVTANYRVGPLGFMSLEDNILPGNLALWDQHLALHWIQRNIIHFGGDPGKVTVFANSAGSFCAFCLYVSPQCEGLFHRVIAQSGPLISNSSPMQVMGKRPKLYGRAYAESLGCLKSDTTEEILKKLRALPVGKLQSSFNVAGSWADMVPSPWKPMVDSWSSNPFLPKNPRDAIIDGEFNKVPVLSGVTSEEGIMMVSHIIREPERWSLLAEQDTWWKHLAEIAFHIHPEDACEMDKELVIGLCKEYEALAEDSNEQHLIEVDATKPQRKHLLQKLVTMFGDGYFKMGTLDALQLISTHGVPAFQYRFAYDGEWKFADLLTMTAGKLAVKFVVDSMTGRVVHGPQVPGVCHAEELHFLFSPTLWGMRNTLPSDKDREVSKRMVSHWVNFTKWGDPSLVGKPWTRVLPGATDYMELGEKDLMKKFDPVEEERFIMWKGIFKERENTKVKTTPLQIKLKPKPVLNVDDSIIANIKQNVPLNG